MFSAEQTGASQSPLITDAVFRSDQNRAEMVPAQYRPNPRVRIGGNGGPALDDPMVLEQVFPGLQNAPAGSIIPLVNNIFDITGPAQRLTAQLHEDYTRTLIEQILIRPSAYE